MFSVCPDERALREKLFDQQVETLLMRGCHRALGMSERDFRLWLDLLRDRLGEVGETSLDNLPFLIVVPHGMLPVARQMELLVVAKKRGYAGIDCEKLVNFENLGSSKFPYLVCDVEDGAVNIGQFLDDITRQIRCNCRHGLTVEEGIALATHSPDLLVHHAVALVDTDYMRYVPDLWLSSGGPALGFDFPRSEKEGRGAPSSARRLTLDKERIF